ncbi:undecaprenyl-phosphate glucose phosphotransferase [Anaerolineales bacterium HSG25]|nr:undecaprenyl-phosphate glucose phosphotransferase [Anaerolineales bacterium HSG25]
MKHLHVLFTNRFSAKLFWVLVDVLLINLAFLLAYLLRYEVQLFRTVEPGYYVPYQVYQPFVGLYTLLLILVYRHQGIYRIRQRISWFDEFYAILNSTATGSIIAIVLVFMYQPTFYSRIIFIYAALFTVGLLGLSRLIKLWLLRSLRRRGIGVKQLLIVGAGEVARTVMRAVMAHPELGLKIVGFVDDHPMKQEDIGPFKAFGHTDNLDKVLKTEPIDEVIVTLPWEYHDRMMHIMVYCDHVGIRTRIVPDMYQMTINRMKIVEIAGIPMIGAHEVSISGLNQVVKRIIDLVLASTVLLFGSPIMGLMALMIKLESPGPVLFEQIRVGKDGSRFTIYKFRSMVQNAEAQKAALQKYNEADGALFKMKDDPRVTRIGRFLRRTSLDELPQMYNVIMGDMSLVGPRPALPTEVAQYQEWHRRRLEAAPGITGLGQVNGRSKLSFDEVALLDIYYIENWSLYLDTKILLQTIPRVILGSGAY